VTALGYKQRAVSENRVIAKAASVVGALTLLSRITGLLRDVIIGYFFGSGMAADAFFVAFRVPNLLRRFVAEGAMTVAFIPVFSEYLSRRSRPEALRAIRAAATLFALLLAAITGAGIAFAPTWTRLFAPGFIDEPGKIDLTISLTRWLFPYIFCVSLVALMGGILNAHRHFAAPALSPAVFNLALIAAAAALIPRLSQPVYALAYGVLLGGVCQILIQVGPLAARGISLVPLWEPGHEAIRRILRLMAPMVFGAAVYQVNLMVDTILASVLPEGTISYLWYADRVFEFPLGIFAVALGTAALPSFSALAARRAYDELGRSLVFSLRVTTLLVIPAAVGIALLATPITSVLFQRGAFSFSDSQLTARALAAFAAGLWSVAAVRIVVSAFYALQDTRTPVLCATAAFCANLLFSLMLMGPVTPASGSRVSAWVIAAATNAVGVLDLRHAGLALSTSLAATVNLGLLLAVLRRRVRELDLQPLLSSLARSGAAATAMAVPVALVAGSVDWEHLPLASRALVLAAAVGVGAATFLAAAWALGSPEIAAAKELVSSRWNASGTADVR